jgi:AcrR family transcriptional regulator
MVGAMVEVVRERGVTGVTVAHVVARSGVSRRTFYELFGDRDECLLAAFDLAVARAAERVLPAYERRGSWEQRIRAGLEALLAFVDDEPQLGALCVIDMLAAGDLALQRRAEVVRALAGAVDCGRRGAGPGLRPSRLAAEGAVGAVLAVVHARLVAGRREPLVGLVGSLMALILLPYRGAAAAAREAARPVARRRRSGAARGDVLRSLEMRLTYRTVRVLQAIAAAPGASNREVADAAGISDQGQISKLLTRLDHLGLIENPRGTSPKGEPNAWRLTAKGHELQQTINDSTPLPS